MFGFITERLAIELEVEMAYSSDHGKSHDQSQSLSSLRFGTKVTLLAFCATHVTNYKETKADFAEFLALHEELPRSQVAAIEKRECISYLRRSAVAGAAWLGVVAALVTIF